MRWAAGGRCRQLDLPIDADDYAGAVAEVRRMGLDPEAIPHYKPPGA
jgi:hypothetical protein